ncbi:MAG: SDR family NAD(P)-dependent oxidoreductase [Syntrophales bacterium]|nr:SDR family NAD(P)-dependent oxidoreductase [Syntrophales bacterium]
MIDKYFGLHGKVAMVTGASRGLGRAIAIGMAEAGADVIAVSRDVKRLEQTADEIKSLGKKALVVKVDIENTDEVKEAVDKGLNRFGKIDVLINNAGISGPMKLFSDLTDQEWMEILSTNLQGTIHCTRHVSSHMIKEGSGRIVNIASVLGTIGSYYSSVYSMTKAAIIQMTRNLALEWARHNINVNTIAPGVFDTDMIQAQLQFPKAQEALIRNIPLRRFGTPSEIVGLAILLASPASSYITGSVFPIDGGFASSKM